MHIRSYDRSVAANTLLSYDNKKKDRSPYYKKATNNISEQYKRVYFNTLFRMLSNVFKRQRYEAFECMKSAQVMSSSNWESMVGLKRFALKKILRMLKYNLEKDRSAVFAR